MKNDKVCLLLIMLAILGMLACAEKADSDAPQLKDKSMLLYVGTYTRSEPHVEGKAGGIYTYEFGQENGSLTLLATTGGIDNPSFVNTDPQGQMLYSVSETGDFEETQGGGIISYAIDQQSGALKHINSFPTNDVAPCYVSCDSDRKRLFVANYGSGVVNSFALAKDGSIEKLFQTMMHGGSGPDKNRQEKSHAHAARMDATNQYLFVPDLGSDNVWIYKLENETGILWPNDDQLSLVLAPAAGPRHLEFHPNGKFIYVINELNNTITAFAWDSSSGMANEIQTITTLPEDFSGSSSCADLHIHPSGNFLYGSNRGHDSIVAYTVDAGSGELALLQHIPTQGEFPRNFAIDPAGKYLLVANQNSDTIVTLGIDAVSGRLSETGFTTTVPTPVCLAFVSF